MSEQYTTEFGAFTWHPEPRDCPHQNEHACPTCDFDGYYGGRIPCDHATFIEDEWGNRLCVRCDHEWWEDPL